MYVRTSRGAAWTIAILLVCSVSIGVVVCVGIPRKITDREVLREAVDDWRRSGEPGEGPNYQIFEQQAGQGYYDDARATARLFKRPDDVRRSAVELAKIRAENGDPQGAKAMVSGILGSGLSNEALKEIAIVQVRRGDLQGALGTISPEGNRDEILLVFAHRQMKNGDFEGALHTAERMIQPKEVFYDIGDELRVRSEQKRLKRLASSLPDRKLAALFMQLASFEMRPPHDAFVVIKTTPCDTAYDDASAGNFAEADVLIQRNTCSNVAFVASRQFATDPAGAEHILLKTNSSMDLALGLAELSAAAADRGKIGEALRLLDELEAKKNQWGYELNAIHEIARVWTIHNGSRIVLKWARSRPTLGERTWARIGIAEALGHARSTT